MNLIGTRTKVQAPFTNYTTYAMNSGFKILSILVTLLILLNLISCSQTEVAAPSCRVNPSHISNHQGAAACVVKLGGNLLTIQLSNGLYSLPISDSNLNTSAQCSAHKAMWQQTGFNVEVENVIAVQTDGTWLFSCKLNAGYDGNEPPFPAPSWSSSTTKNIVFVDPFLLELDNWSHPDHFITVRDAYIAHSN